MSWHGPLPKDDAWRQVTLRSVSGLGQNLWLRCHYCYHDVIINAVVFAEQTSVDLDTSLLTVSRYLKCSKCEERKSCIVTAPAVPRALVRVTQAQARPIVAARH